MPQPRAIMWQEIRKNSNGQGSSKIQLQKSSICAIREIYMPQILYVYGNS